MSKILDSGSRREFETGAVRDIQEGKGRCDLLPLDVAAKFLISENQKEILDLFECFKTNGDEDALYKILWIFSDQYNVDGCLRQSANMLIEVSKHFEDGAKKYGECNWQKGIPTHYYIDSAVRHYLKYLRGDIDERHDRAFVWNVLCCIWTCVHKPELNDYISRGENM